MKEKAITTLSNRITSHVTYGNDIGTPYQRRSVCKFRTSRTDKSQSLSTHTQTPFFWPPDEIIGARNHTNSWADQHFHSIYRYLASWNGSNITGRLFFSTHAQRSNNVQCIFYNTHTEHSASYVINLPQFKCQNGEKFGKKSLPGGQQRLNICHEHYFRCQNTINVATVGSLNLPNHLPNNRRFVVVSRHQTLWHKTQSILRCF